MASVWAMGDIHGEIGKLNALLDALPRGDDDTLVFLGDYVDRGPDSAGVVRRVLAEYDAAPDRTVLLWGNHEDMAASHFEFAAPSEFTYDPYDWFRNGGTQALESYGYGTPREQFAAPCPADLGRLFGLLKTFWRAPVETYPELKNIVWVHAGILPWQEPEESDGSTLLWVRDEFLKHPGPPNRLVVHGHTPTQVILAQPDKIGIDTGAVFGGPLTALQLPERRLIQADAQGRITHSALE